MLLNQGLLWVLGFIFVWLAAGSLFLYRQVRRWQKLTAGASKESLIGVLEKILKEQEQTGRNIGQIDKKLDEIEDKSKSYLQRMGLVRFNPFPETGGDQSFTLAVLDGTESGVVISSLHSRQTTRIYAKPVKTGKGQEHQFSQEEVQAISKACKQ